MYSMAAFGPVLGFLLGAYLLSFHMDSFSATIISIGKFYLKESLPTIFFFNFFFHLNHFLTLGPGDHRWVGMWWGGFLLCGVLLILVAIPFFSFPKTLQREKEKIRIIEKSKPPTNKEKDQNKDPIKTQTSDDTGYGRDVKGKTLFIACFATNDYRKSKSKHSFEYNPKLHV